MPNMFKSKELFLLLVAFIPAGYLAWWYGSLPETIPIHFNFSGKADGYGNKITLVYTTLLMTLVTIGAYLLMRYLPQIDPKQTAGIPSLTFRKVGLGLLFFLSALNIFLIYSSITGGFKMNGFFIPLMGIFFMYIGNLMHSIKPNYFVGIRVPWTLEDPDNWRATHQLGGKLWVGGGILILLSALLPQPAGQVLFIELGRTFAC